MPFIIPAQSAAETLFQTTENRNLKKAYKMALKNGYVRPFYNIDITMEYLQNDSVNYAVFAGRLCLLNEHDHASG